MNKKDSKKKKKETKKNKQKNQTQEYLEGWKRAKADFENYKKEENKRFEELTQHLKSDFILQILPILDSFEEALKNVPKKEKDSEWLKGMLKIKDQLQNILDKHEVEEINPKGQDFNPAFHEAIGEAKGKKENQDKVIQVLQKGYKMGEQIIRPARVYVGK